MTTPTSCSVFTRHLDQADYLFISSNRQWGSLPRIPERFPLTTVYYRSLLGCPPEKEIEWCYSVAQPGMFKGDLGFELVQVFQSDPSIGPLRINDQFAEEAFTVYDHPKVLIFRKTADYDPQKVRCHPGRGRTSRQVVRVTPKRASDRPPTLTLPEDALGRAAGGGTWSELFNTQALPIAIPSWVRSLWYLSLFVLGLLAYPFMRLGPAGLGRPRLPAGAHCRVAACWLTWSGWQARAACPSRGLTISLAAAADLAGRRAAGLPPAQRAAAGLAQNWRYFLVVEGALPGFLPLPACIRFGNPDLWHPWKGGEKPMDFSYFNAVLKSTTFPPYDPWYAGGYLNYYYYGFVLVGVLVKLLGIVPAVAYNLILPTPVCLIAMGAFSLGWNLSCAPHAGNGWGKKLQSLDSALAAALGMAVLGNLGIVRMIYQGYQRLAAPDGVSKAPGFIRVWSGRCTARCRLSPARRCPTAWATGTGSPAGPSRTPGDVEPITEFPFFTMLYADPHAHLLRLARHACWRWPLPYRLCWGAAAGKAGWGWVAGLLLGGLASARCARPTPGISTPTWRWASLPSRIPSWCYYEPGERGSVLLAGSFEKHAQDPGGACRRAWLGAALAPALPAFASWYAQAYSKVMLWKGSHTSITAYLMHWGLFLFLIVSWMVWETRDWMATTPLSALRKLQPYRAWIYIAALAALLLAVAGLVFLGRPHRLVGPAAGSLGRRLAACAPACRMPSASSVPGRHRPDADPDGGSDRPGGRYRAHEHRLQVLPAGLDAVLDQRRCCPGLAAAGFASLVARAGGSPGRLP